MFDGVWLKLDSLVFIFWNMVDWFCLVDGCWSLVETSKFGVYLLELLDFG